jgi:hypothetical protein
MIEKIVDLVCLKDLGEGFGACEPPKVSAIMVGGEAI